VDEHIFELEIAVKIFQNGETHQELKTNEHVVVKTLQIQQKDTKDENITNSSIEIEGKLKIC